MSARKTRGLILALGVTGITISGAWAGALLKSDQQEKKQKKENQKQEEGQVQSQQEEMLGRLKGAREELLAKRFALLAKVGAVQERIAKRERGREGSVGGGAG